LEKPFLQYHALVAILLAAQGSSASVYIRALEAAVEKVNQFKRFDDDGSRKETFKEIKETVEGLKRGIK
jgi:hypothetical protein